jgi:hypothetical protein
MSERIEDALQDCRKNHKPVSLEVLKELGLGCDNTEGYSIGDNKIMVFANIGADGDCVLWQVVTFKVETLYLSNLALTPNGIVGERERTYIG